MSALVGYFNVCGWLKEPNILKAWYHLARFRIASIFWETTINSSNHYNSGSKTLSRRCQGTSALQNCFCITNSDVSTSNHYEQRIISLRGFRPDIKIILEETQQQSYLTFPQLLQVSCFGLTFMPFVWDIAIKLRSLFCL